MLQDLAALTPPLVVCVAFLIGVVLFLRRQMGAGHQPGDRDAGTDIHDDARNAGTSDPEAESSVDRSKS
ncbi:MAG TPA: hypothetical protein VG123_27055 [Streptosporangiaceae bacterium]|jgi:hypothetical protein|nr:hypothetical protein [Streptosporangiaceae bacterium]